MSPDPAVWYLRSLAAERLRKALASPRFMWADEDYELGGEPPEEEGEIRVRAAAQALVLAGVLDRRTAAGELAGSHAAFAAHGLVTRPPQASPVALAAPRPGPASRPENHAGTPVRARSDRPPPGAFRAVRIGAAVPAELAGMSGTLHLLSLVLAADRAALTIAFDPSGSRAVRMPGKAVFPGFLDAGAADDRGRLYRRSGRGQLPRPGRRAGR